MIEDRKRNKNEQVEQFIKKLAKLDDGERAQLKRNAGKTLAESGKVMLLFRQILPYGVPEEQEDQYFLIATLYPFDKLQRQKEREGHTQKDQEDIAVSPAGNLGDSFRRARNEKNESGLNRRLARLLDADLQQLPFQLRQAVLRLTAEWVPINWEQLAEDVLNWTRPSRYVQKEWARAYVTPRPQSEPTK
jgi:CRISPR type I-E-associated protein CasB/Cse2